MFLKSKSFQHISVADLHSKILDVPPSPGGPNSFNFMQFLGNFGKIVCWRPPGELAPPPRGNPGSATVYVFISHLLKILKSSETKQSPTETSRNIVFSFALCQRSPRVYFNWAKTNAHEMAFRIGCCFFDKGQQTSKLNCSTVFSFDCVIDN